MKVILFLSCFTGISRYQTNSKDFCNLPQNQISTFWEISRKLPKRNIAVYFMLVDWTSFFRLACSQFDNNSCLSSSKSFWQLVSNGCFLSSAGLEWSPRKNSCVEGIELIRRRIQPSFHRWQDLRFTLKKHRHRRNVIRHHFFWLL